MTPTNTGKTTPPTRARVARVLHSGRQVIGGSSAWYPTRGLAAFLSQPNLWPRAFLATALAITATLAIALLFALIAMFFIGWLTAPADPQAETGWWSWLNLLWRGLAALGGFSLAALGGWFLVAPIIISWGMELVVGRFLRGRGYRTLGESTWNAVQSSLHMILATMGWRLFWLLATLITIPLLISPIVGLLGLAHVTTIDAMDVALATRGFRGVERNGIIAKNRGRLWAMGLVGALMYVALQVTIVGIVLWLPAMFVGAALLCCEKGLLGERDNEMEGTDAGSVHLTTDD